MPWHRTIGRAYRVWCRVSDAVLGPVRRTLIRLSAAKSGVRLTMPGSVGVQHRVLVNGSGRCVLGKGVLLGYRLLNPGLPPVMLQPRAENAEIVCGAGTRLMNGTQLIALDRIEIGENCLIGESCLIVDSDHHQLHPDHRREPGVTKSVMIEENVFFGARVVVLKGVTIGRDSVVGAGAVVTKDVEPGTIVAGNPAKPVGNAYAM